MEDNLVNDRVIRFLGEHISSIAQLEILLLLQTNPQHRWSTQSVVRELRTDATGTQFGQRMLHYERYYACDPVRVSAAYHADVDKAHLFAMVQRALAGG